MSLTSYSRKGMQPAGVPLFEGCIRCTSADRLLESLNDESVAMLIVDPPENIGVWRSEGDVVVEEMLEVLAPVAFESVRVLMPGAATVMLGSPLTTTAWELAVQHAGLKHAAEIVVLTDNRKALDLGQPRYTTVRWHVKPGLRGASREVRVRSNVVVCEELPAIDKYAPSQRPVELFNYLIDLLTEPGDFVVDPFCGTGSSLVAASMCDRRWLGGDIDRTMCQIATRRTAMVEIETHDLGDRQIHWWNKRTLEEI